MVFNTVMNTLVDTIGEKLDMGYTFTNSSHRVNLLQYADDTCIVAESPAACQYLLSMMEQWLNWSGMNAKITKYRSRAPQGSWLTPALSYLPNRSHSLGVKPLNSSVLKFKFRRMLPAPKKELKIAFWPCLKQWIGLAYLDTKS